MVLLQKLRENRERLSVKLLVSHLSIAVAGAVFLALSLYFYESLSHNVFSLVLDSSPRVEFLNAIGTELQHSQAVLQEQVIFDSGSMQDWQQVWNKTWDTVGSLEKQSKRQWIIEGKTAKLTEIKRLLSKIYVLQWKTADTANTQGDAPARYLFRSQVLPQVKSIREMIDSMIFLDGRRDGKRPAGQRVLLLNQLRIALDGSLSALERMGYLNDDVTLKTYDKKMAELEAKMALLEVHRPGFSIEMADVFRWLQSELSAYMVLGVKSKEVSTSVTKQILFTRLQPLTKGVSVLIAHITLDLNKQLDKDMESAIIQSYRVVWGSRLLVIVMVILAVWLARRGALSIIAPLANLDRAAMEYTAGNLSRDIPEEGSVELRTLSRTFNSMRRSLQESVGLMHSVLETAADAIIMVDDRGLIESFNQAAEHMFGWRSTEILGQNVSLLMPIKFRKKHDEYIRHYLVTRKSRIIGVGREVVGVRKDGESFPIHLSVSHVEVNGRSIFTGIITDLSEQKKIQTDLSDAKDKAEAAGKAKAAFTANMSHEIRTPMNAVIGFAEVVLQDSSLSPATARYVATILSSARALLSIINDILDVSKLDSGKFTLELVCFNLCNALTETLQMLDNQAKDKNLLLEFKYDDTLPTYVLGDPTRLRQVILNLVGNAIKFTERGSVVVSVSSGKTPEMFAFAITDTGIGMTDEQVAKVFESFTQADGATTRRFGGTGLGTTISKQIVEMMGGKIWVDSKLGQGSTFNFTIQMAETVNKNGCLFDGEGAVTNKYFSPRTFRVLLAEDIEDNATLATLRLGQQGHEVCWVKNGREAVEESQANDYDIVLMDVQMPELDGLDATREIRVIEKPGGGHLAILALTASVMREDYDQCLKAGMDDVASKPIDFNELFSLMESLVPQGRGTANIKRGLDVAIPQNDLDFSPLTGIVDHEKAIKVWQDPKAYTKALVTFAAERVNDAAEIKRLLAESPSNIESAHRVLHTLGGLAGNLAIERVYKLAVEIDNDLKNNQQVDANAGVEELMQALAEAGDVIGKLRPLEGGSSASVKKFDAEVVQRLVVSLATALVELNPDAIEPILDQLAEYISKDDLSSIWRTVDAFDFEEAQAALTVLVDNLGLQIEGVNYYEKNFACR